MNANAYKRILNLWPPFFGAGINILKIDSDWRFAKVELKKRWYNINYFGTAFGGSLFSMTDPFYALLLIKTLGPGYIIWDKGASIDFIRPGRTHVHANFVLSKERVQAIKEEAELNERCEPEFVIDILDNQGELVAQVQKKLYVKKKPARTI